MPDPAERPNRPGRPEALDEVKRCKIIALLANGSSRRVAARVVGCAHTTITRTAQRDPRFAAELDAAEHSVEIESLRNIRRAAAKDRYWRAAAWLVERKNPRDFAPRDPGAINEEQIAQVLLAILDPWIEKLPDALIDQFLEHLNHMIDLFHERPRALGLLKSSGPAQPVDLSPSTDRGFAPRTETIDDSSDDKHPPQTIADEPLPASPTAASQPRQ